MIKDIRQIFGMMGRAIKRNLEETLQTCMEQTVYGTVTDESEAAQGCAGGSQYTTYVIGPCVTRVYTGQR